MKEIPKVTTAEQKKRKVGICKTEMSCPIEITNNKPLSNKNITGRHHLSKKYVNILFRFI
jgi:hypothetical protein